MSWLPEDFVHPEHVELPTGHHLRPIRESDVDIDYPAVMGSRETLWARFGGMWGWPPTWWVVASELGGDLERSLNTLVPSWLSDEWSFHAVHYAR
jgi:hypothetical protein